MRFIPQKAFIHLFHKNIYLGVAEKLFRQFSICVRCRLTIMAFDLVEERGESLPPSEIFTHFGPVPISVLRPSFVENGFTFSPLLRNVLQLPSLQIGVWEELV